LAKFTEIAFGSRRVKFYALSIGTMCDLEDEIKALTGLKSGDDPFDKVRFAKLVRVFAASAQRGDPSVTEDDIRAVVDLGNMLEVSQAVLGQAGLQSDGEAAVPTSPQIGGESSLV